MSLITSKRKPKLHLKNYSVMNLEEMDFKTKATNYRGTHKSKAHKNIFLARLQGQQITKEA